MSASSPTMQGADTLKRIVPLFMALNANSHGETDKNGYNSPMKKSGREHNNSFQLGASSIGLVFLSIVSFVLFVMIVIFLTRAFASLAGLAS